MEPKSFDEDLFELSEFSERFSTFISIEQSFVANGFVLSLAAPFGSGKSTFLRMWGQKLKGEERKVVELNAWESDYYGDTLFSILTALVQQLNDETSGVRKAAEKLGELSLGIGKQLLEKYSGVDVDSLTAKTSLTNAFSQCAGRREAMQELKKEIKSFLTGSDRPVLFLVDELDRCRPDFAISYLEVIKHIFDTENAVFILAVDREQLSISAQKAFGEGLDVDEYLRKFIHREIPLPRPSKDGYQRLVNNYVNRFMSKEGVRRTAVSSNKGFERHLTSLFNALNITPRQVQEIFRIQSYALENTRPTETHIRWVYAATASFLATIKVKRPEIYKSFEYTLTWQQAIDISSTAGKGDQEEWWLALLVSGGAVQVQDYNKIDEELRKIPHSSRDITKWSISSRVDSFSQEWVNRGDENQFADIKQRIDAIERLL